MEMSSVHFFILFRILDSLQTKKMFEDCKGLIKKYICKFINITYLFISPKCGEAFWRVSSPSKYASIDFLPYILKIKNVSPKQLAPCIAMPGSSRVLEVPTIQGPNPSRLFGHSNSWLLLKSLKRDPSDPGLSAWGRLEDLGASGRGFGGASIQSVGAICLEGEKWPLALINYEILYIYTGTISISHRHQTIWRLCFIKHVSLYMQKSDQQWINKLNISNLYPCPRPEWFPHKFPMYALFFTSFHRK